MVDYDYKFLTTAGRLDVTINDAVIDSVSPPTMLAPGFQRRMVYINHPALMVLNQTQLCFKLHPGSPAEAQVANVISPMFEPVARGVEALVRPGEMPPSEFCASDQSPVSDVRDFVARAEMAVVASGSATADVPACADVRADLLARSIADFLSGGLTWGFAINTRTAEIPGFVGWRPDASIAAQILYRVRTFLPPNEVVPISYLLRISGRVSITGAIDQIGFDPHLVVLSVKAAHQTTQRTHEISSNNRMGAVSF
jgi:hypothetical protein